MQDYSHGNFSLLHFFNDSLSSVGLRWLKHLCRKALINIYITKFKPTITNFKLCYING